MARVVRSVLARIPGFLLIGLLLWLFWVDPYWPYGLIVNDYTRAFAMFLTDPVYRTDWLNHYLLLVIILVVVSAVLLFAFKVGIWNKAFKVLKVRYGHGSEIKEIELGRVYWIERRIGRNIGRNLRGLVRTLRIADIRIGQPRAVAPANGKRLVRVLRNGATVKVMPVAQKSPQTEPPECHKELIRPRVLFYKTSLWPPINPFAPARCMSRLVALVPESKISSHDGVWILVEGENLERDPTEPYPTFILRALEHPYVDLDVQEYREEFDLMLEKATETINRATQMDTLLLKEQRKYQEVSIAVDGDMADRVTKEVSTNG